MIIRMNFMTNPPVFKSQAFENRYAGKELKPPVPILHFPEYTHLLEGDRFYDSEGNVRAVVNDLNGYKTIYISDVKLNGFFTEIITVDKKTNNIVKRQVNEIENATYDDINISEYSPLTGEKISFSSYDKGELEEAYRVYYDKDGKKHFISYNKE